MIRHRKTPLGNPYSLLDRLTNDADQLGNGQTMTRNYNSLLLAALNRLYKLG